MTSAAAMRGHWVISKSHEVIYFVWVRSLSFRESGCVEEADLKWLSSL